MEAALNTENLPVTTYEHIDPDLAKTWLEEHNHHNRPISKIHVKTLASDLADNRWKITHQGVAFDVNGDLVDGQHRLLAIVESGVGAVLPVTRGLDPKVFEVIDQHRKRTAGQILTMEGIQRDAPRIASMARALLSARFGRSRISQTEAIAFALEHREHFEKYLPIARKFSPAAGAAFVLASMWGWSCAERASERLLNLSFTGESDPMKVFYKATETQFPRLGQGDAGLKEKFAITMNCLTAVCEGRGMKVVRKSQPDFERLQRISQPPEEEEVEQLALGAGGKAENDRPFDLSIRGAVSPRIEYDEAPVVLSRPKKAEDVIADRQTEEEWAEEKERRRLEKENNRKALEALLATPADKELDAERRRLELEEAKKLLPPYLRA
jgi:hypothetical protein